MRRITTCFGLAVLGLVVAEAGQAEAALILIGKGGFSPGATMINFSPPPPLGTAINGTTIQGVAFSFTVGGLPSTDATIDDGPGNTNNITPPNIEGNASGVLTLLFPTTENRLGYGFAVSVPGTVPNATTVQLFDATNATLEAVVKPRPFS